MCASGYGNNQPHRFNGTTGAPLGIFVTHASLDGDGQGFASGVDGANGLFFGEEGYLQVAAKVADKSRRFNATTGTFVDDFATSNGPIGITHGGDHFPPKPVTPAGKERTAISISSRTTAT